MTIFRHATLVVALTAYPLASGQGLLPSSATEQCVGTFYDQSRLETLSSESVTALMSDSFAPNGLNFNFATRKVTRVTSAADPTDCQKERHRVRELIDGVPIFAADFVVTLSTCSEATQSESLNTNTLAAISPSLVQSADGFVVSSVAVPTGYTAKRTREEAVAMVANIFQVEEIKVTTLALEIYPTVEEDYRAWIGTVLVDTDPSNPPHLYQVVVDDETERIILQCEMAGLREKAERMDNLRRRAQEEGDDDPLDASLCQSCAISGEGITWNEADLVECDVQTLYMNNTDRKSLCITGVDSMGNNYTGPGPVPDLHFEGTLDCNEKTECSLGPMPECKDAIHDVHWGTVNFLQYMQENLGVMGGLVTDGNNPIPVIARVHYDWRYCNAFYIPGEHMVTFGDCDCEIFTPLVSTDVVAHEVAHGMTSESSDLIYFMESGGLNEAFSDLMGCALEFTINDDEDTPDFTVGESLGKTFLRHMEFPADDGNSIDSYCKFEVGMNVHYSSGFLNKAYVNAVRSCESKCGTLAECVVLVANTFMYTNLETLSMASNFRSAAEQICRDVPDYFFARSPTTECTADQIKDAVAAGFGAVGVGMNGRDCHSEITCDKMSFWESAGLAIGNFWKLGARVCRTMREEASAFLNR